MTEVFIGNLDSMPIQGSTTSCLMPSDTFCSSSSYLMTFTSSSSPILIASEGWLILLHEMSVICKRPSIPPKSTKAP